VNTDDDGGDDDDDDDDDGVRGKNYYFSNKYKGV
jgi:hypothetical protein